MKKVITHAELMRVLAALGFPGGDVFALELRPRMPGENTIGFPDSHWVCTAVMSGQQSDGDGGVVPPWRDLHVRIPVLMPSDELRLVQDAYPTMTEHELYRLDSVARDRLVVNALAVREAS